MRVGFEVGSVAYAIGDCVAPSKATCGAALRSGSHVHNTVVSESGSGNNVRQGERVDLQVADRRPCCCANLGNAHGSGPRSFAGSIARRHVRWEADWVDDCAGWNFLSILL